MISTDPYSRQQPIPGRGGPGDLGSPATWERRPLAQVTTLTGERAGHATMLMAKGQGGFFAKPTFEPAGTDFAAAIQHAADRAGGLSGLFGGSSVQGVLQAYDGQLYVATLASESGMPVSLEGEGGPLGNVITSSVHVAKLHPALQAVVGRRVMVDLRADQPQPLPPGGTVPYTPIPGIPQQPAPGAPTTPPATPPVPQPPTYPQPQPPTPEPAPAPGDGGSWWDRLRGKTH
ncbi:MAG: hypothetical protein KDC46_15070 [Thermoleophilia bacterium]|nr:hypothetical protein [Thermoleophilia bacterium]